MTPFEKESPLINNPLLIRGNAKGQEVFKSLKKDYNNWDN